MKTATTTLLACLALAAAAFAAPVPAEHVTAELVAETVSVQPGQPFRVALRLQMEPHWHTYWQFEGDVGLPTTLDWELPSGFTAGEIQWPYPGRFLVTDIVNYGYEGEVLLPVTITPPSSIAAGGEVVLKARADWLVCKEVCLPGGADLQLALPVKEEAAATNEKWKGAFASTEATLPLDASGWHMTAMLGPDQVTLEVTPPSSFDRSIEAATFFPLAHGMVLSGGDHRWEVQNGSYLYTGPRDPTVEETPQRLEGVLVSETGWTADGSRKALAVSVPLGEPTATVSAQDQAPRRGRLGSLLLAFLGGLILNLMPCVFPVLGLKIMSFVNQAGEERKRITLHGLVFTVGVLVSFWVLSGLLIFLRAGGEELGWGFQLQAPGFVLALAVILLVFALNLSGLFEVGTSLTAVGGDLTERSGYGGSFFTGVLATVVATPCAAPILAPAIGAALTLPPLDGLLVFTAIALGLSTPYLLLSIFPALIEKLPRPGPWMETFKQLMSFFLYATVGYLLWVLAGQVEEKGFRDVIFALVIMAFACWVYGRWCDPARKSKVRRIGAIATALIMVGGLAFGFGALKPSELKWETWSPERVAELRKQERPIYVDFTARWCATCQVNKEVLYAPSVATYFLDNEVALLKADWTNRDPAITKALAQFGRSAVPVNLYYAPGAGEPVFLPEILTPHIVLDLLEGP